MKIGLIIPASMIISGETSGVVRQAISYQNALLNRGHNCKFIDHKNGISNYDFLMIFQHTPEINHLIERIRLKNKFIKIIFMPIYDPDSLPDLRKKFVYRLPTEKLNYFSSPRIMRLGCDKSERVWVRSKWEKNAILATGTKTPIEIVPLAIPISINRKLIKVKKDINFIFVGHIDDPRKNIERLITSISKISNELHVVGKCSKEKLKKINNLGLKLGVKIIYYGKISDEELIKLYARSKVLCLPSLFEGVGLVALEAACYGAKIAITQIGGAKDYFEENAFYIKEPKRIDCIVKVLKLAVKSSSNHSIFNEEIIKKYSLINLGLIIEKNLKLI